MVSENIILTAPNGMHARPAGELVKLAKSLDGKVTLATAVKSVSATSMLGVLSLALKSGAEITVTADGGDEAANLRAVVDFIANITE
ncbi:MAG: HPr family phosphocarrier protein [Alistipes sp.]|jgi:phosphotransferase system HPr (HPr) family protein|nr:HPr family phosphocarrier protein [Alistipes sp.]